MKWEQLMPNPVLILHLVLFQVCSSVDAALLELIEVRHYHNVGAETAQSRDRMNGSVLHICSATGPKKI